MISQRGYEELLYIPIGNATQMLANLDQKWNLDGINLLC